MKNEYLYIDGNNINYADSVFSGTATVEDINKFCNEKAYEFHNSNLKNYDKLTKKQGEEIVTTIVNDWTYGKDADHAKIPAIHQRINCFKIGDKVLIKIIKQ